MKKLVCVGLALVTAVVLVGVGRSWSQDKPEPPAPRTRIALLNLTYVISNYDKYKVFKKELDELAKPYQDRIKEMQDRAVVLKKEYDASDPVGSKRDEIEKALKKLQGDLENLNEEAKNALSKKTETQMVGIYKEIRSASERYAKAHEIEVLMHYNEPANEADLDGPANVSRKMSAGACVPLYMAPGVDVTNDILAALNSPK